MYRWRLHRIISAIALVFAVCNLLAAQENAPLLRYGFASGKQYAFQVKILAEAEKYDEVREGVLTYTVASAKDKEFVLKPSGSLNVQIKPHANESFIPRGFPPMGSWGRGVLWDPDSRRG